jgi:hypothetical protein
MVWVESAPAQIVDAIYWKMTAGPDRHPAGVPLRSYTLRVFRFAPGRRKILNLNVVNEKL